MIVVSVWLGLSLLISAFAWLANRRLSSAFLPFAAMIAAFAIWTATGTPRFTSPGPGKYTVLGARIDVDVAIYVLVNKADGVPVYYRLPYTTATANSLQGAEDAGQGQPGSVKMQVGEDGGATYSGDPPVSSTEAPKQAEQPAAIQIP